jgi:hypothetical protein
MVAHGGTSVVGSFIQTLTMVGVATGWTECLSLVNRDGSPVLEAARSNLRDTTCDASALGPAFGKRLHKAEKFG